MRVTEGGCSIYECQLEFEPCDDLKESHFVMARK